MLHVWHVDLKLAHVGEYSIAWSIEVYNWLLDTSVQKICHLEGQDKENPLDVTHIGRIDWSCSKRWRTN